MTRPDLILLHAPSNYDFREHTIMYGPISDVIPSTPVFEMYPIGLISIAAYLEKNGVHTRIINIANRMLRDRRFDVERFVKKLSASAFGIDLHWLPHAHGSLELARIVKSLHPSTPVIMGGLSASYFHQELIAYPQVDLVVRGDSTEIPMLQLMKRIKAGEPVDDIPNLSWKDKEGVAHHNPLTSVPTSLDEMPLDYAYPIKSVLKYRDLVGITPFGNWMRYPLTCAVTCRGCNYDCVTCGGSRYAYKNSFGREKTAYRSPQLLVNDIVSIQRYLNGPVFVIGDIRQPGEAYADELLWAMNAAKVRVPIVLELFAPGGSDFFKRVNKAIPNYNIQWSPDSTDEEVRRAFGKGYSNGEIENTIQSALENGCKRFDLFFMIGLPKQTYRSVMENAVYLRALMGEFGRQRRLLPFISPLAPFLDPASKAFENPEKYGYRLSCRTLEEHRKLLKSPSWKYMLNYETEWMTKDEIVMSTYDAALAFNQLKLEHGLIAPKVAAGVEARARGAMELMKAIDRIVIKYGFDCEEIMSLKQAADKLSSSSICQKKELHWPAASFVRNAPRILWAFATGSESRYGA
ncbi:MAG: TIGR04190 family B12-binding domain/radical SAM domain protein [Dehalococcoidia bacterium]|nr:MAG: TIGR04190 family B12-binding domain/radical SAM domain protein [Dehalococcoidia bacterium]